MRLIGPAVVLALGVALAPRLTDAQPVKVPCSGSSCVALLRRIGGNNHLSGHSFVNLAG